METDSGVTNLLIELIINVVLLISFFVVLLLAVRWRRRRKEQAAKAATQSPPSQQTPSSLPEPEVSQLSELPQAAESPDDDDQMPDWLNNPD
jgi:flagellar biosynthesis/type III secretory pathway M-ring protein FliF/YscJ